PSNWLFRAAGSRPAQGRGSLLRALRLDGLLRSPWTSRLQQRLRWPPRYVAGPVTGQSGSHRMAAGDCAAGAYSPANEWHPIAYRHGRSRRSHGCFAARPGGSAVGIVAARAALARTFSAREARGAFANARFAPDPRTDRLPCSGTEGAISRAQ